MKRLLLVGGGHSHLEVLRQIALQRPSGIEVALLSPQRYAVYSGMIPGVIAGDYLPEECRIDLVELARRAGAVFVTGMAAGLDADTRHVLLADGKQVPYEVLSFDVGSIAATHGVSGVAEHAITVKPLAPLVQGLSSLEGRPDEGRAQRIVIVGAGAAGVEIALTLAHRLNRPGGKRAQLTLVSNASELLPGFDAGTRRHALRIAGERGIQLQLGRRVVAVDARGLALADGTRLDADAVIWAAGPAALPWLRTTPLTTDAQGFIAVNECLQSRSHREVFAAGDCAGNPDDPWPKSGVFAVRQGPVLAGNLLRALRGEPLRAFQASSSALAILNCGGRRALASWRGHAFAGRWVWIWKDWLDRSFMRRYR